MIKHKGSTISSSATQSPGKVEHLTANNGIRQDVPVTNLTSVKNMTNLVLDHDGSLKLRDPLIAADKYTASKEAPTFIKYLDNNTFLLIYTEDFNDAGWAFIKKIEVVSKKDLKFNLLLHYIEVTGADEYTYPEDPGVGRSVLDFSDKDHPFFKNIYHTLAIHKSARFDVIDNQLQILGVALNIKDTPNDIFSGVTEHPIYRFTQFNVDDLNSLTLSKGLKVFVSFYKTTDMVDTYYVHIAVPEVTTLTGDITDATTIDFNLALQNPYAIADLYNYGTNAVTQILAYAPDEKETSEQTGIPYLPEEKDTLIELKYNILDAIFGIYVQAKQVYLDGNLQRIPSLKVIIVAKQNFSFMNLKEVFGSKAGTNLNYENIRYLDDAILNYFKVTVNGVVSSVLGKLPNVVHAGDVLFSDNVNLSPEDPTKINISLNFAQKVYNYASKSTQDIIDPELKIYLFDNNFARDTDYSRVSQSKENYVLKEITKSFEILSVESDSTWYVRPINCLEEYGFYIAYDAGLGNFYIKNLSLLDSTEYQLWHRYAYKFLKYDTSNDIYPYKTYLNIPYFKTMQVYFTQSVQPEKSDFKRMSYQNVNFTLDTKYETVKFAIYYYTSEAVLKTNTIYETPVETIFSPLIVKNTPTSAKIISSVPDNYKNLILLKAYTMSSKSTHVYCNWEVSDRDIEDWGILEEFVSKNRGVLPFYSIAIPDTTGESKESLYDISNYTTYKTVVPFNIESGAELIKNRPDVQPIFNTELNKKFKFNIYFYKDTDNITSLLSILNPVPVYFSESGIYDKDSYSVGSSIYEPICIPTTNLTYSVNDEKVLLGAALTSYLSKREGDILAYYLSQPYNIKIEYTLNSFDKNPTYKLLHLYSKAKLYGIKRTDILYDSVIFLSENDSPIIIDLEHLALTEDLKESTSIKIKITFEFTDLDEDNKNFKNTKEMYIIYNYYSPKTKFMLPKPGFETLVANTFNNLYKKEHYIVDKPIVLEKPIINSLKLNIQYDVSKDAYDLFDATNTAHIKEFYDNVESKKVTKSLRVAESEEQEDILILLGYAALATPFFGKIDQYPDQNYPLRNCEAPQISALAHANKTYAHEFTINPILWITSTVGYYGCGLLTRCQVDKESSDDGICSHVSEVDLHTSHEHYVHIGDSGTIIGTVSHYLNFYKTLWCHRKIWDDSNFTFEKLVNSFKNNPRPNPAPTTSELTVDNVWMPISGADDYSEGSLVGWENAGIQEYEGKPVWQWILETIKSYKKDRTPVTYNRDIFKNFFNDTVLKNVCEGSRDAKEAFYNQIHRWGYNIYHRKFEPYGFDEKHQDYWDINGDYTPHISLQYQYSGVIKNNSKHSHIAFLSVWNNIASNLREALTKTALHLEATSDPLISIQINGLDLSEQLKVDFDNLYTGNLVRQNEGFSETIPNIILPSGDSNINITINLKFTSNAEEAIVSTYESLKAIASAFTPTCVLHTSSNLLNIQYIPYDTPGVTPTWDELNEKDVDPRYSNKDDGDILTNKWYGCPIWLSTDDRRENEYTFALQDDTNNPGPVNFWLDPNLGITLTSNAILLSSKTYVFDNSTKSLVVLKPEQQPELLAVNELRQELSTSRLLQNRFFVWGVQNFENALFYSKLNSYEFPILNTINFTGDITQVIEWRNYILVFTTKCIYLLSYNEQDDTYSYKLIHQNEGIPLEFARSVKTILNGIIFRGYSGQVYKLIPNQYSSSDNILNIKRLSDGVEQLLEDEYYSNIEGIRYPSFAFSDSENYKLFIIVHNKGLEAYTMCFTYNYVYNTWTKQQYNKIKAIGVSEVEGIPYLLVENNKHYEFYKTSLWITGNIKYQDYVENTKDELTVDTQGEVIPFDLEFGQKASKYSIPKSYLEARIHLVTLSDKDLFPFNITVWTDGIKQLSVSKPNDPNSHSSFTKEKLLPELDNNDILSLSRSQMLNNIDTDSTKETMREYIIKYSGQGRTINFKIEGESQHPFKFYSLDSLSRNLPKK